LILGGFCKPSVQGTYLKLEWFKFKIIGFDMSELEEGIEAGTP
jgi:hypothetical protein